MFSILWYCVLVTIINSSEQEDNGLFKSTADTAYEHKLVESLFKHYDSNVRPAKNFSKPITVYVDPIIYSLIQVDEREESLKFIEWRTVAWKDEFLQWNPDYYGGLTRIMVPSSQVWKPDIIIFNTVSREEAATPVELNVQIYSNGIITWGLNEILTVRCTYEIMWFPFDTQNCTLQYGTWSYPSRYLRLNTSMQKSFTIHGNSEWELLTFNGKTKTEPFKVMFMGKTIGNDNFDELHFHLVFKRKPTYYIFVLIIPTFIIATISILGLFSPFSSGGERSEKVNLGLTTLLTMAIMLQIVADSVPRTREGLPLLGLYMMYEFVVASAGTCVTVGVMYLHRKALQGDWDPPEWLMCITRIKTKRVNNNRHRKAGHIEYLLDNKENMYQHPDMKAINQKFQHDVLNNVRVCTEHITAIKDLMQEQEHSQAHEETWGRIFDKLDVYLLFIFMIGNISLTIGVFSMVIFGHHK